METPRQSAAEVAAQVRAAIEELFQAREASRRADTAAAAATLPQQGQQEAATQTEPELPRQCSNCSRLQSELATLSAACTQAVEQRKEAAVTAALLQSQIDQARRGEMQTRQRLDAATRDIEQLLVRCSELEAQCNDLGPRLARGEEAQARLQQVHDSLQTRLLAQEATIAEREQQAARHASELTRITAELQEAIAARRCVEISLQQAAAERDALRRQVETLTAQLSSASTRIQVALRSCASLH